MNTARALVLELKRLGGPRHAAAARRFFKTGEGQYSEGDKFLGVRMPVLRALAKEQREQLPGPELEALLRSPFHEARMLGVLVLVYQFKHGDEPERDAVVARYLANTAWINNWDLVDASAYKILGPRAERLSMQRTLRVLVRSESLWERRIAMVSTLHGIKSGEVALAIEFAEALLDDGHDLIHKAAGWMLREVGKQELGVLRRFLKLHGKSMPRTMLRYAIERLPEAERKHLLTSTGGR